MHPDLLAILEADERARDAAKDAADRLAGLVGRARDDLQAARERARDAAVRELEASVHSIEQDAARSLSAARQAHEARRTLRRRAVDAAVERGVNAYLAIVCGSAPPPRGGGT